MAQDFKQEIFDKISKHLFKQKRKSVNRESICQYKFGSLKCAAGALIPDTDYDPDMEGKPVYKNDFNLGSYPLGRGDVFKFFIESGYSIEEIKLIADLQAVHDLYYPAEWPSALIKCSLKHGLKHNIDIHSF